MKRFEFSLDRVLKVKRQQERLAEMEQSRAALAADAARDKVRRLAGELERVAEEVSARLGQPVAPQQWVSAYELSDRLGRSMEVAEQAVTAAEQALATAAQERAQIATEVEALATLRKQQWDRWRQEVARVDQERLEELALRSWRTAQTARAGAA